MNPYNILDLPSSATNEEIKQKYRSLAQQHHPDKGGDPEKFKEINLAYSILIDPVRRKIYDETGIWEQEPNFKEEALGLICEKLGQFLWNMNVDFENLVVLLKNHFSNQIPAIDQQILATEQTIRNFERALKRMKKKNGGENFLKNFIQLQIDQQKNRLKQLEYDLKLHNTIIEMLEDYEYGDVEFEMLMHAFANVEVKTTP